MIVWLCEGCIKARGGPERIGAEVSAVRLFGACSDCGAAWCLYCRTAAESKSRGHLRCSVAKAAAGVSASAHRPFRLPTLEHDAPTVPDLDAAARAAGCDAADWCARGLGHEGNCGTPHTELMPDGGVRLLRFPRPRD